MLNIKHSLSLHCATGQSLQLKSSVTVSDNNISGDEKTAKTDKVIFRLLTNTPYSTFQMGRASLAREVAFSRHYSTFS